MPDQANLMNLAVALGIGVMIGVERGWTQRSLREGRRMAGLRTFSLVGLLGGTAAYAGQVFGPIAGPLIMLVTAGAVVLVVLASVLKEQRKKKSDVGITTEIALISTLALGMLAGYGETTLATATAVVIAIILGMKPALHNWLEKLKRRELLAAFKFLLMSLVILPVLPNEGFGPWQALNPYIIWLMVVLISGLSFAGYVAVKTLGARRGMMLTGILGGVTSSTAVAVSMARMTKEKPTLTSSAAAATLASATVLYPRVLLVTAAFSVPLAKELLIPLAAMTLASAVVLWVQLARGIETTGHKVTKVLEPFDLSTPLRFGGVLAAVMLATAAMQQWFGDAGLLIVSAIAGLTDVDAPTLTAAQSVQAGLAAETGSLAILIAIAVNQVAKLGIVSWIGGLDMGVRVGLGFGTALLAGAGAYAALLFQ